MISKEEKKEFLDYLESICEDKDKLEKLHEDQLGKKNQATDSEEFLDALYLLGQVEDEMFCQLLFDKTASTDTRLIAARELKNRCFHDRIIIAILGYIKRLEKDLKG